MPLLGPPLAVDPPLSRSGLARWSRLAEAASNPTLAAFIRAGEQAPVLGPLLAPIFAASPFLSECLLVEPEIAWRFAVDGPAKLADRVEEETRTLDSGDRARVMAELRRARRRVALLTGLADLAGHWPLEVVTARLTRFADLAVAKATQHLLDDAHRRGEIELGPDGAEAGGHGLIVLGMGKLGAFELNYSSDIDLIVLFDDQRLPYRGGEAPMAFAVRFTRSLVHILESKTREGYVFRTDLRLRPHIPGHPLAISTDAAELYYERHGQNWERAAFIKARAVAGDLQAGRSFLAALRPYVWRKHLDYAAIRDIHSIKRQINAHRGFGEIRLLGHDLKVGRGGIREIEFFAQVQQLILGGREAELRAPATCAALTALAEHRWVEPQASAELVEAYELLRALEHRLQMVADRQTQALPQLEDDFARFAAFAGEPSPERLGQRILGTLKTVERHYAALFESEPDLALGGDLVFTGTDDDPATLDTLSAMGFADPAAVSRRIRAWHHGHIRATRSTRARELLTELLPSILDALHRQARIDEAFRLFDTFLSSLPAGVQIFSLLRANPRLLALLADLTGAAPRLAPYLARNVDLFESLLQPDFFEPLPDAPTLREELAARLKDARDLQDTLDAARRWAHGRQFQAGLQVLLGVTDFGRAALTLTSIAEVVIAGLLPWAERWLEEQHGRIEQGSFAVLGLGKLGARELTIGSDLDLVFVYEAPPDARSKGERPLPAPTWYARLAQRLVSALSARTAEGQLFEIDMRLRPSGNAGPVACSLGSFARYHDQTAEIWEQQSLCRARVISGQGDLSARITDMLKRAIARERNPKSVAAAVRHMRERIFKEHGRDDPWAVKHARGGLVEIEFATQFLQLTHAHAHRELLTPSAVEVLGRAGDLGLIAPEAAREVGTALELQQALQMVLRLSETTRLDPAKAPEGLKQALMRAASRLQPDIPPISEFAALELRLVESQAAARQFFDELCPAPDGDGDTSPP
jgi:[glutamine synthetase] adenylyltransferase / [glutamine synthetase]-adenylyl-L-tyrosine phosphorylase